MTTLFIKSGKTGVEGKQVSITLTREAFALEFPYALYEIFSRIDGNLPLGVDKIYPKLITQPAVSDFLVINWVGESIAPEGSQFTVEFIVERARTQQDYVTTADTLSAAYTVNLIKNILRDNSSFDHTAGIDRLIAIDIVTGSDYDSLWHDNALVEGAILRATWSLIDTTL